MKRSNTSASLPVVISIVPRTFIGSISAASLPRDESPPCYSRLKLLLVPDVRAGLDTSLDIE